jgi:hypothetical protein
MRMIWLNSRSRISIRIERLSAVDHGSWGAAGYHTRRVSGSVQSVALDTRNDCRLFSKRIFFPPPRLSNRVSRRSGPTGHDQVDEAESRAAGEYSVPRGTLTITAPIAFGRLHVVPVVNAFLAEFPQINISLTLSDHTLDLVDEHVDLAVRMAMLSDSTLVATKVGEIRRVVCGSPAYFSVHGTPKTLDDLAKHMCVTYTALAFGMTWIFNPRDGKPSRGVRPLAD